MTKDVIEMLEKAISLRSKEIGVSLDEDVIDELIDYLMGAIDNTFDSCVE